MDGYKAYQYYLATKLHFTTDKYNVFGNQGRVRGTRESFEARNDRYIFEKLARKYETDREIIQFLVANFAYGNNDVIYSNGEGESNYINWIKRKQSMTKMFIDDLATMLTNIERNKIAGTCLLNFNEVEYPVALKMFIGKQISVETLRIIDDVQPFMKNWKSNLSVSLVWEKEFRIIDKLKGFVNYDKSKIQTIWNHFREELDDLV